MGENLKAGDLPDYLAGLQVGDKLYASRNGVVFDPIIVESIDGHTIYYESDSDLRSCTIGHFTDYRRTKSDAVQVEINQVLKKIEEAKKLPKRLAELERAYWRYSAEEADDEASQR